MKKAVIVVGTIVLVYSILDRSGVLDALLIFLLTGAVPGTGWSLSASLMLTACSISALVILFRVTALTLLEEIDLRRMTRKYLARQARLPKKRFRRVAS